LIDKHVYLETTLALEDGTYNGRHWIGKKPAHEHECQPCLSEDIGEKKAKENFPLEELRKNERNLRELLIQT